MDKLKYKVISSRKQYKEYCRIMRSLDLAAGRKSRAKRDEIELLALLIEAYDREHFPVPDKDPVEMLHYLMNQNGIKAAELASEFDITKGYLSQILNYKKEISKDLIRKLAAKFKVQQETFNRPYTLTGKRKKRAA